jgi:hypothetical protein
VDRGHGRKSRWGRLAMGHGFKECLGDGAPDTRPRSSAKDDADGDESRTQWHDRERGGTEDKEANAGQSTAEASDSSSENASGKA